MRCAQLAEYVSAKKDSAGLQDGHSLSTCDCKNDSSLSSSTCSSHFLPINPCQNLKFKSKAVARFHRMQLVSMTPLSHFLQADCTHEKLHPHNLVDRTASHILKSHNTFQTGERALCEHTCRQSSPEDAVSGALCFKLPQRPRR